MDIKQAIEEIMDTGFLPADKKNFLIFLKAGLILEIISGAAFVIGLYTVMH